MFGSKLREGFGNGCFITQSLCDPSRPIGMAKRQAVLWYLARLSCYKSFRQSLNFVTMSLNVSRGDESRNFKVAFTVDEEEEFAIDDYPGKMRMRAEAPFAC